MNREPDVSVLARMELHKRRLNSIPDDQLTILDRELVRILNMSQKELYAEAIERNRDKISPAKLGLWFDMSRKALRRLPLRQFTPFEHTSRGFRQVIRFSKKDVLQFLTACNAVYGLYAFDEPLLKPDRVVELCGECGIAMSTRKLKELRVQNHGPEYVALNTREIRYRPSDVFEWLDNPDANLKPVAPSELIMQGIDHGD